MDVQVGNPNLTCLSYSRWLRLKLKVSISIMITIITYRSMRAKYVTEQLQHKIKLPDNPY